MTPDGAPYCFLDSLEALRRGGLGQEELRRHRRRVAACVGDPEALSRLLGAEPEEFAAFYADSLPPQLDTDSTIDTFLTRFGAAQAVYDPLQLIDKTAARLGAAPATPDTPPATDLSDNPDTPALSGTPGAAAAAAPTLSLTLVDALIRDGSYVKALQIIESINLPESKKSRNFALKIRFLRKLAALQRRQEASGRPRSETEH